MLVPAARPLRSRSRLSPVTNAESTAGKGRGRLRPPAQTPVAMHRGRRPPAREHGPHQVARAGDAVAIFPRTPSRESPSPETSGSGGSPLTCSKKELQHYRRQQLHGPGLGGGGEAAITLGGGGHRTLAREPGWRSAGDPGGHGRLPASGCKLAWDLRGARGRWASLYSLRLSDRPSPSASSKREPAACRAQLPGSTERSSACSLE